MLQRVMSQFFVEFFCLAVPKNFAGDTFVLCSGYFPVANKIMDEKWGVSKISVDTFCLKVPKISVRKLFNVSLYSSIEKI